MLTALVVRSIADGTFFPPTTQDSTMTPQPIIADVQSDSLPQYRCHKLVRAARIHGGPDEKDSPDAGTRRFWIELGQHKVAAIDPDPAWFERHRALLVKGNYLVVYEDGYRSVSPAQAFEDGYTAMTTPE